MRHTHILSALLLAASLTLAAPASSSGGWISMGPAGAPRTAPKRASPTPATTARQFGASISAVAAALEKFGCTDANQCSFVDGFAALDASRWTFAHDYANGVEFDNWWSNEMAEVDSRSGQMRLSVDEGERHGKPYKSGQMQTFKWHGYGCYEVRIRPPAQEGLITTFFTYTGKYDAAPGEDKFHNEVDLEFVYKRKYKKMSLQANFFTNGKGGNEKIIPLKFNPTKKMHNYGFKWTSKGVAWYVDGKKMYTARKNTPKIENGPHKIMMNVWPVSKHASGWGGNYEFDGVRSAVYSAVRFTRGEDCKIRNSFGRV